MFSWASVSSNTSKNTTPAPAPASSEKKTSSASEKKPGAGWTKAGGCTGSCGIAGHGHSTISSGKK